jgi:NDP-sugar pyrophosphorylase family protein
VEAIILAGGKAERLGEAAKGGPKALVEVGGRPLISYQLDLLRHASVNRVIVSCAAAQADTFRSALAGAPVEIEIAAEPEPLGRGGGLRYASKARAEKGPLFALNGDELIDVDLRALMTAHEEASPAATIVVAQVHSAFGIVELDENDMVRGFSEAPKLPHWVNSGIYVLGEEALALLPERGDHETSTFPQLADNGRLRAFRHTGVWLTVNTPKELRKANEYLAAEPAWLSE